MSAVGEDWDPPQQIEEYRLIRQLGRGGMGQVYLAEDLLLRRLVAIKFMAAGRQTDKDRRRLFMEARAIARIKHPNVVAIHRVAEYRGRPFLVSEYVRGRTLASVERPMGSQDLLPIALDLARALAAAHRGGVLHRDIKPENVILSEEGTTKLLDFGIAQLAFEGKGDGAIEEDEQNVIDSQSSSADSGNDVAAAFGLRNVAGTPGYMAPEIWLGEPATEQSDIYSLGIVLFELCTGAHPFADRRPHELWRAVVQSDVPSARTIAPSTDASLARVIDCCLSRNPSARPANGEALRQQLELLTVHSPNANLPEGNPYRGLSVFDAEHRNLFFGRRTEALTVLERLRGDQRVVVAGDSGTGKSSLCRAGVLPLVADGALGSDIRIATLLFGGNPLLSIAAALCSILGGDEKALEAQLRNEPDDVAASLRKFGRIMLFIDQFEEVFTLAGAADGVLAGEALHALTQRDTGVRLLVTARSDFLTKMVALPRFGNDLPGTLYLLGPLADEVISDVVVGPAAAKGFRFESQDMVRALIDDARAAEGGLPLLQFALAELWEARDSATRTIPLAALDKIGGVAGALARHADNVMAALPSQERAAARAIFLQLLSEDGIRQRRTHRELIEVAGHWTVRGIETLDALVRGRLLLAQEAEAGGESAYAIAHEALVGGWDTLRGWLSHDAEGRALQQRVDRAAAEWERLGRIKDALWSVRLLRETQQVDETSLTERNRAFLRASRRRAAWRRAQVWAVLLGLPLALIAGELVGKVRTDRGRALAVKADESLLAEAQRKRRELEGMRKDAYALFDGHRSDAAEERWREALAAEPEVIRAYAEVEERLERLLNEDPRRKDAQAILSDVLLERAIMAEHGGRILERDDMVRRLGVYGAADRWVSPAHLSVETSPDGADVSLARYELVKGRWEASLASPLGHTPISDRLIPPGSLLLQLTLPGHASVRVPVLLKRDETTKVRVELPISSEVPKHFVYIPAGPFLYGTAGGEEARNFYGSQPMHIVSTASYLMAENETTYGDWIDFLRSLPRADRAARSPIVRRQGFRIALTELVDGEYRLTMGPENHPYVAGIGDLIHYQGRHDHASQNWLRMPVSGITFEDAIEYTKWLRRSGRMPGARPCTEYEWEKGARGADGRSYPHAERIEPNEANFDLTYSRVFSAFGPDEVGARPASDSPFGIHDLAGNVWEWTAFTDDPQVPVGRGGSFFQSDTITRPENRAQDLPTRRDAFYGFRVCASWPAP